MMFKKKAMNMATEIIKDKMAGKDKKSTQGDIYTRWHPHKKASIQDDIHARWHISVMM